MLGSSCRPEDLLGYERVEAGATTNLVGNNMTRGAVDLVAAELKGMADGLHGGDPERLQAVEQQRLARRAAASLPERARAGPPAGQGPEEALSTREDDQQQQQTVGPCRLSGPPDMAALRKVARELLLSRTCRS